MPISTGIRVRQLRRLPYSIRAKTGPNFGLRPSKSVQAEAGIKARFERQTLDFALFDARSNDEIVPLTVDNGRAIFQNVDRVRRRGVELAWKSAWGKKVNTQLSYTWLDARFGQAFVNGQNAAVAAGNRLPGVPMHSLFAGIEYRPVEPLSVALEMRTESKAAVDDRNSDAAPGYAVLNVRAGYEFPVGPAKIFVFGRIDNLLDKTYAGSLIVNDSNRRFFEPAAGRRLFVGLRSMF